MILFCSWPFHAFPSHSWSDSKSSQKPKVLSQFGSLTPLWSLCLFAPTHSSPTTLASLVLEHANCKLPSRPLQRLLSLPGSSPRDHTARSLTLQAWAAQVGAAQWASVATLLKIAPHPLTLPTLSLLGFILRYLLLFDIYLSIVDWLPDFPHWNVSFTSTGIFTDIALD